MLVEERGVEGIGVGEINAFQVVAANANHAGANVAKGAKGEGSQQASVHPLELQSVRVDFMRLARGLNFAATSSLGPGAFQDLPRCANLG